MSKEADNSANLQLDTIPAADTLDYEQVEGDILQDRAFDQPLGNPEHEPQRSDFDKSLDELVHEDRGGRKTYPQQHHGQKRQNQQHRQSSERGGPHQYQQQKSNKRENYSQQFVEGKMIGGQMFYEQDLEEYQNYMKGRRVFLSNLNWDTQWKYLKDHMRQAGDVVRVDIFQNDQGKSKGCGVVEFKTQQGCQRALEILNEQELDGRKLFLKLDTDLHPLPGMGGPHNMKNNNLANNNRRDTHQQSRPDHHQNYQSGNKGYNGGRDRINDYHHSEQIPRNNLGSNTGYSNIEDRVKMRQRSRSRDKERSPVQKQQYHQPHSHQSYHSHVNAHQHPDEKRGRPYQRGSRSPPPPTSRDRENNFNQRPLVIQTRDDKNRQRSRSPGYTIRCDNLPENIDSLLLRKAFKDFGRIEYCRIVEDDYGVSKGYGFVDFETKESALSAAKRMDRAKFNGREVRVEIR